MHTSNSSSKVTNFTVTCCCCGKTTCAACSEYLLMASELKQREFVWLHCKGGAPAALQGCISDKLATQGVSAVTMVTVCVCVCRQINQDLKSLLFKVCPPDFSSWQKYMSPQLRCFVAVRETVSTAATAKWNPVFIKEKKKKNLPACL